MGKCPANHFWPEGYMFSSHETGWCIAIPTGQHNPQLGVVYCPDKILVGYKNEGYFMET